MSQLKKIISGGQTGADQGGLRAGRFLGLQTGGWMPKGFRTEAGNMPELEQAYGLQEHSSPYYPPRTEANVIWSDATLIFGNISSSGSSLTIFLCEKHKKRWYGVRWPYLNSNHDNVLLSWLEKDAIQILNIAGNRESKNPGIEQATFDFLTQALKGHLS